jgi:ubiquinol-cytochrome c reductase cytochrome c1 subunit
MIKPLLAALSLAVGGLALAAETAPAPPAAAPAAAEPATTPPAAAESRAEAKEAAARLEWEAWHANNDTSNIASLQLGARNFMNYCIACHSLKYMRYSRMATDLKISTEQLQQYLMPIEARPADYITTTMNPVDATNWFGKAPPDLSLIARARGPDYLYRFLRTFYTDPGNPQASYNLAFETEAKVHATVAMPAVLSDLSGVQTPVYDEQHEFLHFTSTPGRMTPAEYDSFVRDTVNFLDYVGEPSQVDRRSIGIWTVLFLLLFTWIAYLLKQEYWKAVH